MPSLNQFPTAPTPAQDFVQLPGEFPEVPEAIVERFGADAQSWNDDLTLWWKQTVNAISDANDSVSSVANNLQTTTDNLLVQQGNLTLAITTEKNARITADEALTQYVITVFALASSSTNISAQTTAPVGPALNDLWVDTSNILNPITYFWNGAAWVPQTTFIMAAAVSDERTARIGADGNLSSKYTLTVIAGNVVTGMNITSSSGPGTNISSVIFRASDFLIYNGVTGLAMFVVSGSTVTLGQTFVVDAINGKVYIGVGTYGNSNTSFYLDSTGHFSLKDTFTWDGSTLTIKGTINLTTTQKAIISTNASFLTWQGDPGSNQPGLFIQSDSAASGGLNVCGYGASTTPWLVHYRAGGSFGAPSAIPNDTTVGIHGFEGYDGAAWHTLIVNRAGITNGFSAPYYFISNSQSNSYWVFNYDGKMYFNQGFPPVSGVGPPYIAQPYGNLYNDGSNNRLTTDGDFVVGGGMHVLGNEQIDGTLGVTGDIQMGSNTIRGNGTTGIDLSVGSGIRIAAGRTPTAGALAGYINLIATDGTILNVPFYS